MTAPPRRTPRKPGRATGRAAGESPGGEERAPAASPDVVFPDEASDTRGGARLSLPSSGLAADILALAEAAEMEPPPALAAPEPALELAPAV
ncbi:MAG TPA: hypothetical protein VFM29_01610, partial [Vicinamibacteria bacterium]|nr:hypothetical protein [Vicinamibacteria bacterium]